MTARITDAAATGSGASERQELELFRGSLRRLLAKHWPEPARAGGGTPEQRRRVWEELVRAGLLRLGDPAAREDGGWPVLLLAMEELGRASCPAPLAGLALANEMLSMSADGQACLAQLRSGPCCLAVALGAHDGDRDAGGAVFDGPALSGTLRHVEGLADATQLLVLAEGGGAATAAMVSVAVLRPQVLPGMNVPPLSTATLDGLAAVRFALPPSAPADLNLSSRVLLLARALGAARRMFELAADYARVREQFGQPIGSFQAVQHKLANALIAIESADAMLRDIGQWRDAADPRWRVAVLAAFAVAAGSLRQVALDAQQVFGAAGYDESHELPRHFRRVHADLCRHGGVQRAERELATRLLDSGESLPETNLGPAGEQFRQEVRLWLDQHWGAERKAAHDAKPYAQRDRHCEFERALGERGWLGISWPREHGGQERSLLEQLAYIQELERVDAPGQRMSLQAPALVKFGTAAQQQHYLPRLLRGEIRICLGYSEAGAGSDLAALRTSAVLDGDEWVITGEKLWSTHATFSDYVWLAARTDPSAQPRHAGISMFIVPLNNHPGVAVRPGMAMYGRPFSTLSFDHARVPRDALIGPVNGGWKLLTAALSEERIQMASVVFRCRRVFDAMVAELARTPALAQDAGARARLGALGARVEAARALLASSIATDAGSLHAHAAAMSKVYSADLMQHLGEQAVDLFGMQATLAHGAPGAILNGELEQLLRHSLMYTIGGGTQEIQRTLIATRGLGLGRKRS